jgi:hypothetical protein
MIKKIEKNKGFVILFAVTLAAIFLSIALGVSQIAYKENIFGTSAKNTNNAFFAADTGGECALYYDKLGGSASVFADPSTPTIICNNVTVTATENSTSVWTFNVSGLGSDSNSCAVVTITKTSSSDTPPIVSTSVVSKGYNVGSGPGTCSPPANAVERELDTNY